MIYEHRTYLTNPGKMPALLARFENHTIRIWDRLGIRSEGFWLPLSDGENNELVYFLVWEREAEREALWPKFLADEEWRQVYLASEADGPLLSGIVEKMMRPASFARL